MEMDKKKHNFSPVEKKLFLRILDKYKDIIENKNTDGTTLRNKNAAWDQIALEYNASPVTDSYAANKQLRRLWMNLKQRHRNAIRERQQRLGADATLEPDTANITPEMLVEVVTDIDSDSDFVNTSLQKTSSISSPTTVITLPPSSPQLPHHSPEAPASALDPAVVHTSEGTVRRPQSLYLAQHKLSILNKEHEARERRLNELHIFELHRLKEVHQADLQLMEQKLREAKAKAELAEYLLNEAKKGNLQHH